MVFSALLIQQTHGTIEAHFGIFALLAFILLYCDWRPSIAAATLIAVHHLSFAWLQATGAGVYVFPQGRRGAGAGPCRLRGRRLSIQ